MKYISGFVFISLLQLVLISTVNAEDEDRSEIFAQRGEGVVTQQDFTARADKIPANLRLSVLRDGNRMRDILNDLLLRAQLVEEAREAGYDQEQIIIDRMRLAAEAELAEAWLLHYVENQPPADYEQLAREYYQLNKDTILSSPKIDVSHILISTGERPDDEAIALADSVYQQVVDNPALFDELTLKYSEDPSLPGNHGHFKQVKKGDMVKPFEVTAFALSPGEISAPVKTDYGYHIIRLDDYIEPKELEFEAVKPMLIERQRKKHEDRVKQNYLASLTQIDVQMTEEALEEMVRRQFGEDYIAPETASGDSE